MPTVLVPLAAGKPIPVSKAVIFFGRHPECDVVITNSRKVSRKHCCLAHINDHFIIRDLGSMNGVRVNEQVVRKESPLKIGDELWVGDVGYRLTAQQSRVQPRKPAKNGLPPSSDEIPDPMLSQSVAIPIDLADVSGMDGGDAERSAERIEGPHTPSDEVIVLNSGEWEVADADEEEEWLSDDDIEVLD